MVANSLGTLFDVAFFSPPPHLRKLPPLPSLLRQSFNAVLLYCPSLLQANYELEIVAVANQREDWIVGTWTWLS